MDSRKWVESSEKREIKVEYIRARNLQLGLARMRSRVWATSRDQTQLLHLVAEPNKKLEIILQAQELMMMARWVETNLITDLVLKSE
jgi:hypothetical protein